MKGYKVFNSDWTCRGFKYEVGKTYEIGGNPVLCDRGFHFYKKPASCFNYYAFNPSNKVAEVEATGEIRDKGDKCCTNEIRIIREIPWCEVLDLVNVGENCTGLNNAGDWNAGDWNTGDMNIGNCNTGNSNTGDWNTGIINTGDYNAGDWNTGNWNTGSRNIGNCNTGDWNNTNWSEGCFNTEEMDRIRLFNKSSVWTLRDWKRSEACSIMRNCPSDIIVWKSWESMNDEEKKEYPEAEIAGGYLAKEEADVQAWWDSLPESDKNIVMALPNFDADIFKECTGIGV